jgi:hypothetical protein
MEKLSWPQVVLFLGLGVLLIGGTTTLVVMDKDVNAILTIIGVAILPMLSVAGASLYQKVDQKLDRSIDVGNGKLTAVMTLLEQAHQQNIQLALKTDPATYVELPSVDQAIEPLKKVQDANHP